MNEKTTKHKTSLLVTVVTTALVLSACAGDGSSDTTDAPAATVETGSDTTESSGTAPQTTTDTGTPLEPATIQFWHVYSGPLEETMNELVDRFEAMHPGIDVEAQFTGGYFDTSQKIAGAIQADDLPNLTVAFEDAAVDWHRAGVVLDLTPFVNDPEIGVDNVDDFLPVEIARNTYLSEGGRMLSFPWTVANAVLFYNQDMLSDLGFEGPAETWDEFLAHCKVMLEELNQSCYSINVDASMFNATGYTFGGYPSIDIDNRETNYDEDPWTRTIDLFATIVEEGYGFPTVGRADVATANLSDFSSQQVAYIVQSSRWIPFVEQGVAGSFEWSTAALPQATAGADPISVLFGPNAIAFDTDEAENRATWEFIKFLSSADSQAFWAKESGNLPSRLSVGESAEYAAFLEENPAMAAAWEILPFSVSELPMNDEGNLGPPPFSFRVLIEDVEAELLTGNLSRDEAQSQLVEEGAAILGEHYASLLDS